MSDTVNLYDDILGNRIMLSVVRQLSLVNKEMTGREVASSINYSPQSVLNALNHLEELVVVTSKRAGKAKLYKINARHWFVSDVLNPVWQQIGGWMQKLGNDYAAKLKPKPISIIIYGSFAKGEETSQSDMDLLFVFRKKRPDILDQLISLNSDIYACYGHHPSPKAISVNEFKKSMKAKKGFIRNVFLEGKAIYGLTPTEVLDYDSKKS